MFTLTPELSKPEAFKTKKEICQHFSISLSNLDKKLKAGKLPKHKLFGRVLLKISEVESVIS
ncbi:hypothetical protein SAE01_40240 [Segetibacter aerophilus]|uniref:DNA-binding protein n=1 Tax=Segetibacter aerophilus TaxID=670293 RepID=A0A512BHU1_9BACT|nr:hypothetical protein SAE01_40240 [Segetibacter aerophilus]